ncbi:hypothetical protein HAZT_HAZT006110 [Hyalella azteca]|uniref:Sulfakinin n=1 Tax=Hyalella azteca TaxID=294128 RepID=A0A6A0GZI7_HYAAZ|nr:hypothetical protein HAZT_HAZT006110 [Hyalella azteca]
MQIHGGFAPNTRELEADRKNLLGTDEYEDFDDDPIYRFHDADKRQHPDYGHLRFGKRAEFGDYGHLRFGRRSHSSPDTNAGTAAGVTSDGDGQ